MKTVGVTEFRSNIKKYLDVAQNEKVVIHRGKGRSYVVVSLNDSNNVDDLLNADQIKAIDKALLNIENGEVRTHDEAINILRGRHPQYFK